MKYRLTLVPLLALWGTASTVSHAGGLEAKFVTASDSSFSRPHDLTLSADGRFLYVADVGNNAVKVLDPATLETLGAFGQEELRAPHDVAFDARGRLWVADSGNDRIAAYAVDGTAGKLTETWDRELGSPEGVAPSPDGTLYVTNASRDNVLAIKAGRIVAEAGGSGGGKNRYRRPHDVTVAPDGRVFVADPGNDRVQILSADLAYQAVLEGPPYDFDEPKYLAFDGRGWLYISDEYNNQIKILDQTFALIAVLGNGERGLGPNRFNKPEGVEVRGERVWISDTYNDRIVLYRLTGAPPVQ